MEPQNNENSSFNGFEIELDDNIAILRVNRPEKKNAMNMNFFNNLPKAIKYLDNSEEIRAIILTAKGDNFSAGLDLSSLGELTSETSNNSSPSKKTSQATNLKKFYENIKFLQNSISSLEQCLKPVIAVIQGYCLGGGIDLISACDIRIGTQNSIYSIREVKMAMVADLGTLQRLPKIISIGHLNELAFTGKDIDAEYAKAIGLINYVGKDYEDAMDYAVSVAKQIASNSPLAVKGIKKTVTSFLAEEVSRGLEDVAMHNTAYLMSNDLIEAVSAFFEKREPKFEGS
jgi:enoyl-CoA hydratase